MKNITALLLILWINFSFAGDTYNYISLRIFNLTNENYTIDVNDSDRLYCIPYGKDRLFDKTYNCGTSDAGNDSLNKRVVEAKQMNFKQDMIVLEKPEYSMLLTLNSKENKNSYKVALRYGSSDTNWNEIYRGQTTINPVYSKSNYHKYPYEQYNQMASNSVYATTFISALKDGGKTNAVIFILPIPKY